MNYLLDKRWFGVSFLSVLLFCVLTSSGIATFIYHGIVYKKLFIEFRLPGVTSPDLAKDLQKIFPKSYVRHYDLSRDFCYKINLVSLKGWEDFEFEQPLKKIQLIVFDRIASFYKQRNPRISKKLSESGYSSPYCEIKIYRGYPFRWMALLLVVLVNLILTQVTVTSFRVYREYNK